MSLEAGLRWEGGPVCKGILWLQERQRALKGTAWFSMDQALGFSWTTREVPLSSHN